MTIPQRTKPLGVADYLASPEQAVALLNMVIASGGDLDAIKQAVGVVAKALERAGLGETRITARPSERMQGHHPGH